MADIFISYSSSNRDAARVLSQALAASGYSVWWDREIVTGEAFDQVIERELTAARCVVVLWSAQSIGSEWVKNEAAAAAERGVLLPAALDATRPPLEFRRRQTADLQGFAGDTVHPGYVALRRGVDRLLGQAAEAPPARADGTGTAGTARAARGRRAGLVVGGVAITVILVAVVGWRQPPPASAPPVAGAAAGPSMPSPAASLRADIGLAAIEGLYEGDIVADSRGPSQAGVQVQLRALAPDRLHISSAHPRIGSYEVPVQRLDRLIVQADSDGDLSIDTSVTPARLALNPRHELAFVGHRRSP